MAHVQIAVRDAYGHARSSIDGVLFIALLSSDGVLIGQQQVTLFHADADFNNLNPGNYTAKVTHPIVLPSVSEYHFGIQNLSESIQVFFVYSEQEQVFLRSYMELRAR